MSVCFLPSCPYEATTERTIRVFYAKTDIDVCENHAKLLDEGSAIIVYAKKDSSEETKVHLNDPEGYRAKMPPLERVDL